MFKNLIDLSYLPFVEELDGFYCAGAVKSGP